ncbi:MAG: PqqD family protein [bacterium]
MNKQIAERNLLTLRPKWNQNWEKTDNGLTVVLIPKFGDHFLGNWLKSQLKNPNYRLKLDEIGSFVWQHCNGLENVQEIGDKLTKKYGEKVEPVYERLNLFFKSLEKSKSITWIEN